MKYELAVFDFDGTLADSFPWLVSILDDLAERFHFKKLSEAELEHLRRQTVSESLKAHNVPLWKLAVIGAEVHRLMARDIHRIRLFPGMDEMLADLHRRGTRLALVTSNTLENARAVLGAENAARFDFFACGVSLLGKPARVRPILARSRVHPKQAIMIGDELRDLDAARKLGMYFGAVGWGYTPLDVMLPYAPELVFNTVSEMAAALI